MVEPKASNKHAHFDESELNEYDKQRGQKVKIDEPKTPWEDEDPSIDIEMTNEQDEIDPEVETHLEEARINKDKNVQIMHDTLKMFQQKSDDPEKDKNINIGELLGKLNAAKNETEEADAADASKLTF